MCVIDQNPRNELKTLLEWKTNESAFQGTVFKGIKLPCAFESKTLFNLLMVRNWNKYVNPMYKSVWEIAELVKTLTDVHRPTLERMWATVEATYPLVENYSMTETVETINTPNIKTSQESNSSSTQNTTTTNTTTADNTTSTSGSIVSGVTTFENVTTFSDTEKSENNNTTEVRDEVSNNVSGDVTASSENTTNILRSGTDTTKTTTTRKGNIGVTTNQQMLKEEREIATFNFLIFYLELIEKHLFLNIY